VEERFWSKVDMRGPDECWLWKEGQDGRGYGQVKWHGKTTRAHRISLEIKLGRPIRAGYDACHTRNCTSRVCCNPNHLYEGTRKQNMQDAVATGALIGRNAARGSAVGRATTTEGQAREIKRLLREGVSPTDAANRVGVKRHIVYSIAYGLSWAWLE
jgi:hypothetical protein